MQEAQASLLTDISPGQGTACLDILVNQSFQLCVCSVL